jgi:hypothetical protein
MKRIAKTVSQLCPQIPLSRTEYYRLRKLPGAPPPRADGAHSIAAWRKFAREEKSARAPSEKEALEMEILRLKAERAAFDLAQARQEMREKILNELTQEFLAILSSIRTALFTMKNQLSPKFEGQTARAIFSEWNGYERKLFTDIKQQVERRVGIAIDDEGNLIPNGGQPNGNGNGNGKNGS